MNQTKLLFVCLFVCLFSLMSFVCVAICLLCFLFIVENMKTNKYTQPKTILWIDQTLPESDMHSLISFVLL